MNFINGIESPLRVFMLKHKRNRLFSISLNNNVSSVCERELNKTI